MKLKIVLYPDPILGKVCSPVPEITDEIRTLARDMLETMYEAPGVGLAAPQVGKLINMVVYDPAGKDEPKQPHVIINPEVTLTGREIVSEKEGCLSVPMDFRADVFRSETIDRKSNHSPEGPRSRRQCHRQGYRRLRGHYRPARDRSSEGRALY